MPKQKSEPKKHHYIPAFYLRNWEDKDSEKLIEFRSLPNKLITKEVSAQSTGYESLLYSHPADEAGNLDHSFESEYLSSLDNDAAIALRVITNQHQPFSQAVKTDWSRLIISLMNRSPEDVSAFKECTDYMNSNPSPLRKQLISKLSEDFKIDPQECYNIMAAIPHHEIMDVAFKSLGSLMEWSQMIPIISSMKWCVRDINNSNYKFLTSDRPILTNRMLATPAGFLALPVAPNRLLIIHGEGSVEAKMLINGSDNEVVRYCNRGVVGAARQYVWSTTRNQEGYIKKWMGTEREYSVNEIALQATKEIDEPLSIASFVKTARAYGAIA